MPHAGLSLRIAAGLLVFWVLLSGKFDAVHVGAGVVTALFIAFVTAPLRQLEPAIGASVDHPLGGLRLWAAAGFTLYLAKEIVVSSLQVAYVVLHPRMPIQPRVLRFRTALPHPLARLTLANAITLTPGTVTLDVDGDEFVIHALTPGSARGIEAGAMRDRVRGVFGGGRPVDEA